MQASSSSIKKMQAAGKPLDRNKHRQQNEGGNPIAKKTSAMRTMALLFENVKIGRRMYYMLE